MLDALLRWMGYFFAMFVLAFLIEAELLAGVFFLMVFLGEWFYPVFFEVLSRGETPGKRALGLLVVCAGGAPVSWSESLTRNLLMAAGFLPGSYLFSSSSPFCRPRGSAG